MSGGVGGRGREASSYPDYSTKSDDFDDRCLEIWLPASGLQR
jgi:hypothetical protein